ncbi:sulfite exporter TauE/SafE family protein [Chitinophaga varians]|uniref:sulfite exporter TauE/SafE family protein n=1 Tax=Chitinophaga varians TaxID=2202339 RepID=UPI00165F0A28|nr:sulfite exporter TauE/SafE family protein [Chitinophaga varians]MBC9910991.1 sulfite exporter TauE/SafE family protein [Chitinophaga varians]
MIGALILGFLGSFHCIGMCGPIALTLPVQHLEGAKKLAGVLLYNAGRITTYALLGMIFGWVGRQLYLGGLQQWLSIGIGILLLLIVLLQYTGIYRSKGGHLPGIYLSKIKSALGALLRQQRFSTLYGIGVLNGLLPCGLVYLAIAGAVATGATWKGSLFMAAFGAGTLPAMMTVTWFSHLVSIGVRNRIRSLIPFAVGIMGILLILRGLNLGIPYISPVMSAHSEKVVERCCHKP